MIKTVLKKVIMKCGQYYEAQKKNAFKTKAIESFGAIGNNYSFGENAEIIGWEHIFIGENFYAGHDLQLQAWKKYGNKEYSPKIEIGNNVVLASRIQISCINNIKIGNDCLFGNVVMFPIILMGIQILHY